MNQTETQKTWSRPKHSRNGGEESYSKNRFKLNRLLEIAREGEKRHQPSKVPCIPNEQRLMEGRESIATVKMGHFTQERNHRPIEELKR